MISGRFSDGEELIFEIELIAANGFELPIDVVLDTGFSGWLAIDPGEPQAKAKLQRYEASVLRKCGAGLNTTARVHCRKQSAGGRASFPQA